MPIVRQYGDVGSIAKLAKLAGESLASRRDYERREEALQRAQEMAQQQALQQQEMQQRQQMAEFEIQNRTKQNVMAIEWENQKMLMNSQQDFELEKMRERALAEREIAKEIREMDKYDKVQEYYKEQKDKGSISDTQYTDLMNRLQASKVGMNLPSPRVSTTSPEELERNRLVALYGDVGKKMPLNMLREQIQASGMSVGGTTTPTTTQRIRVVSPQGQTGTIDETELKQYLAQGFRRI